uniref:Uncharacterized protein n=1 Tax=Aegilops tauschii subsp. strangulata TaxID=200361 RepID=A0A453NEL6_AEGTS
METQQDFVAPFKVCSLDSLKLRGIYHYHLYGVQSNLPVCVVFI